ncbi:sla2 Src-like adaptor 2 [Quaeritorhiza haematococci]|nr:sla2 Src-like adaptor 2 [Quaeritorhiza haematococci]
MSYPGNANYGYGSGTQYVPRQTTERVEEELALHIKKALTPEETAPKQKHVRACIVYTWDIKSSGSFWLCLKSQPIVGDEVMTWKALITFHKVVRGGHPNVLRDGLREVGWLETLARSISHASNRGYGILIRAYVQFLAAKLDYHQQHPAFTGTFDYDEYVTLKGIEDPNEGFETINDLLTLLEKLDGFQNMIFTNFRGTSTNEARIAALVPLVEESYGIYQFLVSMLTAMHQIIGSVEVLAPLREKFNAGHYAMFKFYYECSNLKYLTSLITVPRLSQDPPNFLANGPPTVPPRKKEEKKNDDLWEQEQYLKQLEQQRLEQERAELQRQQELELQRQQQIQQQQLELQRQMEMQRQMELQRQQELARQQELLRQQEEERLRQQQSAISHMENQMLQQRFMEAQQELQNFKQQALKDRSMLEDYNQKMRMLENQLSLMNLKKESEEAKDDLIRKMQEEINQWKQKYEALAKLYAQLRKEHLDLLSKFKDAKDASTKIADEARREADKIRKDHADLRNDHLDLLAKFEKLKGEGSKAAEDARSEAEKFKRMAEEARKDAERIRREFEEMRRDHLDLLGRFERVKGDSERAADEARREAERIRNEMLSKNSESAVLQSGLDQSLLALAQLQKV